MLEARIVGIALPGLRIDARLVVAGPTTTIAVVAAVPIAAPAAVIDVVATAAVPAAALATAIVVAATVAGIVVAAAVPAAPVAPVAALVAAAVPAAAIAAVAMLALDDLLLDLRSRLALLAGLLTRLDARRAGFAVISAIAIIVMALRTGRGRHHRRRC